MTLALAASFFAPQVARAGIVEDVVNFFGFAPAAQPAEPYAAGDSVVTVDADTHDAWRDVLQSEKTVSTKNIGRIWTDKTVAEDQVKLTGDVSGGEGLAIEKAEGSDFLVGLSALSSTSNLTTTTTISKPLDIVLVLDNSESMDDSVDGRRKIDILKDAAKGFAASVAGVSSDAAANRIAIVGLAAEDQEPDDDIAYQHGFMDCASDGLSTVQKEIEGMRVEGIGSSHSNYGAGLKNALKYVGNAREEAVKVVIVFGDGAPGGNSQGWIETKGCDWAIEQANLIKEKGATIYTVGVFDGAQAEEVPTYDEYKSFQNLLMQYLSSNYGSDVKGIEQGGTPIEGEKKYYLASEDYDELAGMFEDIFEDITTTVGSGSPIEEITGSTGVPGTLTFTDRLGDYMEVKGDKMTLVYAGEEHKGVSDDGGKTFKFGGTVDGNSVYGPANLSQLTVTVDKTGTGDKVTIQMPASLIPLRTYTVADGGTGGVQTGVGEAYPVRLFYSVGLKDGVEADLANPDDELAAYVDKNTDEGGHVVFYSNAWSGKKGESYGNTTAEFTPSSGNRYYYFTGKTPLYVDEKFSTPATQDDVTAGKTLYFKDSYYVIDEQTKTATPKDDAVKVQSSSAEYKRIQYDETGAYIPARTQRSEKIKEFTTPKEGPNTTGTATTVVNPTWSGNTLTAHLGNNGKLAIELPATLAVSKTVEVPEGFDKSKHKGTKFQFEIALNGAEKGAKYTAVVKDAQNQNVVDPFKVTVTNGKITQSLKDGETLYIYGLPAGAAYTVSENLTGMPFEQTSKEGDTGTLKAGEIVSSSFTNMYEAAPAKLADGSVKVQKNLTGRDWRDGDAFAFGIGGEDMPSFEKSEVTVYASTSEYQASFGTVSFNKPGTYTYYVWERDENQNPIPGINYSNAAYKVEIEVSDEGKGQLVVDSTTMTKVRDDAGDEVNEQASNNIAVFTNSYSTEGDTASVSAHKQYTDNSGDNFLTDNKFEVQIKAEGGYATEGGSADKLTIAEEDVPMPGDASDTTATVKNIDTEFRFPDIKFNGNHVGNTYVYAVTEVAGNEEKMTYDTTSHTVEIKVTEDRDEQTGAAVITAQVVTEQPTFTNTYDPTDVTLSGDDAIGGTKTLTGRDAKDGEKFEFTLMPTGNTLQAINAGTVTGITAEGLTATVEEQGTISNAAFAFGETTGITFSRVGTYTFEMKEVAPETDSSGMKYDRHACEVVVKVSLDKDGGMLKAEVSYGEPSGNAFTNVYTASASLNSVGGIKVSKTLTGRNMQFSEFTFTVSAATNIASPSANYTMATPEEIGAKISESEKSFTNGYADDGMLATMSVLGNAQFTQDDAGKVFAFLVDEEEGNAGGITYDSAQYVVLVYVDDDGDGTLTLRVDYYHFVDGELGKKVDSDVAAFANRYHATGTVGSEGMASIAAEKILSGRNMLEGEFSFEVKDATGATVTTGNNGAPDTDGEYEGKRADVSFVGIDFDSDNFASDVESGKAKKNQDGTYTYTYKVSEKTDALPGGVTPVKDAQSFDITITVKDEGNGTLSARVGYPDGADKLTFKNVYNATSEGSAATVSFVGAKKINENGWSNAPTLEEIAGKFTFTLTGGVADDGTAAPMPAGSENDSKTAINNADGSIDFGEVEFTMANVWPEDQVEGVALMAAPAKRSKTFTYTVSETGGFVAGVTNDTSMQEFTVTVTDDGSGNLTVETNPGSSPLFSFTNTYEVTEAFEGVPDGFKFSKKLEGRDWAKGDEFTFELRAEGKVPMPEGSEAGVATVEVTSANAGSFSFGGIRYDAEGTYAYTVREVEPENGIPGITYSEDVVKVVVTVADNGEGGLSATAALQGENDAARTGKFTNTYASDPVTVGGEGNVAIVATKTLTGRPMVADEFDFKVVNAKDLEKKPVATGSNAAADDGAPAPIAFTGIEYTTQGLIADAAAGLATRMPDPESAAVTYEYTYQVSEITASLDKGVSAKTAPQTITVRVMDDGRGTLSVDVEYLNGEKGLAFENTYGAGETEVLPVGGTKVVRSAVEGLNPPTSADIAGKYEFSISGVAEDGSEAPLPSDVTATNGETGAIGFGGIVYTMENVFGVGEVEGPAEGAVPATEGSATDEAVESEGATSDDAAASDDATVADAASVTSADEPVPFSAKRTKTFTYTVKESGKVDGVTNDGDKTFTVTVTDNGDGTLGVSSDVTENGFVFTNTYRATPPGPVTPTDPDDPSTPDVVEGGLSITKVMAGRDAREGEFEFQLVDARGNVVSTGTNDAEGKVALSAIQFDEPGDYAYTLGEVDAGAPGVEYDGATYKVIAHVRDDGSGRMYVTWEFEQASVTFENAYVATPTYIGLTASKTLTGRDLVEGEFAFEVREGGKTVRTATNAADGSVRFDQIEFAEVGEHDYEIVEVKGDAEGVTYDETVYTVHVSVTDPGDGQLDIAWSYGENGAPAFVNSYVEPAAPAGPEPPAPEVPHVGDAASVAGVVILSLSGLALALGSALIRRRSMR